MQKEGLIFLHPIYEMQQSSGVLKDEKKENRYNQKTVNLSTKI